MTHVVSYLLFLLSVLRLPFSATAQSDGIVSIGASLSATEKSPSWLSPSGDFAFGFRKLNNNLFLLSIWYDKIPEKTVVWYANEGNPVPAGSKVQLVMDKGLVLNSPQGEELWYSNFALGAVAYGYMNDTGNFALKDQDSEKLWGTFGFPTDTILPGQTIEKGGGGGLTSLQTATNFTPGRFRLTLLDNGNLVLATLSLPSSYLNEPYYESGTGDDTNSSNAGSLLVFNDSGYLYVARENGEKVMLSQQGERVPTGDFYQRATLDYDGVFTQYYRTKANSSKRNESWSVVWSAPDNICTGTLVSSGSGTCGFNSICTLGRNGRPICECPRGYYFDPLDHYGSCKPDFTLSCDEGSYYDMEELSNTDWSFSDYLYFTPNGKEECRNTCLHDCWCSASYFLDGKCWLKTLPLRNGRMNNSVRSTMFLKVGKKKNLFPPNPEPKKKKKNRHTISLLESVLLSTSIFLTFVLACVICLGFFCIYNKKHVRIPKTENIMDPNLRFVTYKELAEATGGFKEELGRGAFGIVYKGEMKTHCGNNLVAVKKLERTIQDLDSDKEFNAEVNVIGQTHHKNLVRLLGFCNEGPHRLLVYEYMSNGTLGNFLFGERKPSWNQRTEIAIGIARGLLYLHEECSSQIIHCDIKPQNILLDDFQNARIADFGLAKLLMIGQSHTNTAIRGTKGYVAPEWFRNTPISVKVDVYSFGVLLLEIICCRKSVDSDITGENAILADWAFDCYMEGALHDLVKDDMEAMDDRKRLERLVMVALWCIQEDFSLRPTMRKVTLMLEGVVQVPVPPCPPPFSIVGN